MPTIPSTLGHTPAVLAEMLDYLHPSDGDAILDCTFGGGGYTQAILAHACCFVWAIDRDPEAIERGFAFAQNLK
ncbi:MAG: 16S rRNA (cytosine(1402)-N(4))-methyltransferase, partial [Acetobacter sp.]|nr:16S rRNA (cytosine(1402)-N(4))-methyltransferase [Acetobacter sp.]